MSNEGVTPKRWLTDRRLFFYSAGITTVFFLLVSYWNRPNRGELPKLVPVGLSTYISAQLKPANIIALKRRGFEYVADIRPDDEARDQPSSTQLANLASAQRMHFEYIPVPHDSIPEEAVQKLQTFLAGARDNRNTVLYCRSGRRAARLFALVEATRANGPDSAAILKMVHDAGFSADDLKDDIARRIAQRGESSPGEK